MPPEHTSEFAVGWGTLAMINGNIAQLKGRGVRPDERRNRTQTSAGHEQWNAKADGWRGGTSRDGSRRAIATPARVAGERRSVAPHLDVGRSKLHLGGALIGISEMLMPVLMIAYFAGIGFVAVLVVRALLRMADAPELMVARLGAIENALREHRPPPAA